MQFDDYQIKAAKYDLAEATMDLKNPGFIEKVAEGDFDAAYEIITSENLKADETDKFMANAFRDGAMRTTGTDIDKILPAMSRFGGGNRQEKKKTVIEKLKAFFEKYFGVV